MKELRTGEPWEPTDDCELLQHLQQQQSLRSNPCEICCNQHQSQLTDWDGAPKNLQWWETYCLSAPHPLRARACVCTGRGTVLVKEAKLNFRPGPSTQWRPEWTMTPCLCVYARACARSCVCMCVCARQSEGARRVRGWRIPNDSNHSHHHNTAAAGGGRRHSHHKHRFGRLLQGSWSLQTPNPPVFNIKAITTPI